MSNRYHSYEADLVLEGRLDDSDRMSAILVQENFIHIADSHTGDVLALCASRDAAEKIIDALNAL